jgi:hypothetical protein
MISSTESVHVESSSLTALEALQANIWQLFGWWPGRRSQLGHRYVSSLELIVTCWHVFVLLGWHGNHQLPLNARCLKICKNMCSFVSEIYQYFFFIWENWCEYISFKFKDLKSLFSLMIFSTTSDQNFDASSFFLFEKKNQTLILLSEKKMCFMLNIPGIVQHCYHGFLSTFSYELVSSSFSFAIQTQNRR